MSAIKDSTSLLQATKASVIFVRGGGRRTQMSSCVVRKYRKLRRKESLRHEYRKLRSLLPARQRRTKLRHKVGVVDAAYRYICDLQTALLRKFSSNGVPSSLTGVVGEEVSSTADVQALAIHIIQQQTNTSSSTRTHHVSV